jgi:hypothetical protein
MTSNLDTRESRAVLVTFANGISANGVSVSSNRIFARLMAMKRWYLARPIRKQKTNMKALFYEAGAGFRGHATIKESFAVDGHDKAVLEQLGVPFLKVRLDIDDIVIFEKPVPGAPHVHSLSFVSNKKHWGHSFRISPRLIPAEDFQRILRINAASDE